MNTDYTLTTHVGNITVTRIVPLEPEIVRFALTAKIPNGATRFNQQTLSLYAALLLTRTKRKHKSALEEFKKRFGIELEVTTGIESITFMGSVRHEHVTHAASLLTELLFEPLVDDAEFTQKKKLAIEANREGHDDAKRIAHVHFVNALYAHEPRLKLDTLSEELVHIKNTVPGDIVELEAAIPESVWYLSIVGDANAEYGFMPLCERLAKHARTLERAPITGSPLQGKGFYTTVPSKTNIEVRMGNMCSITDEDPSFIALDFGIDVLGKVGGFSGRLMSIVREKEGLTYGIYAHTNTHHKGDSFHYVIRTFFMAKDYEKGIASTKRELTAIVEKGITNAELSIFKEILANQFVLAHESNATRLHVYHTLTVRGYNEHTYRETQNTILALTRAQVNHALRTHIDPHNLIIAAAGPISKDGTPLITGGA